MEDENKQEEKNHESNKPESKPKSKKSPKSLYWGIGISLLVVVIAVLATVGIRIYKYQAHDSFTTSVAQVIPFPAAIVAGQWVSYSQVIEVTDALYHYLDYQSTLYPDNELLDAPNYQDSFKDSLELLTENAYLSKEAASRGIEVTSAEIDEQLSLLTQDASQNGESVEETIKKNYNWTIDQFKKNALEPQLIETKLVKDIAADQSIEENKTAKELIETIRQQLVDEEITFADAAAEYSDDTGSAENEGDLGEADPNLFVEEFRDALILLEEGELSEPVLTYYGWHLIRLIERVESEDGQTLYHAQHILLSTKNFEEWLLEQMESANISRLIKTD